MKRSMNRADSRYRINVGIPSALASDHRVQARAIYEDMWRTPGTKKSVAAFGLLLPGFCVMQNSPTIVLLRNISVQTILMHAGLITGKGKQRVHGFMGSELSASGSKNPESNQTITIKSIQHSVPSHLFTVCVAERNVPALFGESTTEVFRCSLVAENSNVLHRAGHNSHLSPKKQFGWPSSASLKMVS